MIERADGGDAAGGFDAEELMISVLAACFDDEDQICNGIASHIPVCAIQLALLTHAPGLVWLAGAAGLSPALHTLPISTFAPSLWQDAVMYLDQQDFWNLVANPRYLQKFCVGAAQVDQFGNMNNSIIGDLRRPKVRLPGTAGLGDMGSLPNRLLYWVNDHTPRTMVRRVDFRSAIGFLDGYGERARLGIGGGPELVITNLAVFDFAPDSQRMRLLTTHPGVDIEQVLAATGFEPELSDTIGVTATPTAEQLRLIRDVIDPLGYRYHHRSHRRT